MTRTLAIGASVLMALLFLVPVALAAEPELTQTGRVLISTGGHVTVAADEHLDAVVVVNGEATIEGTVDTLVAVDSTANVSGATIETVVAVRGPLNLGPGTVVTGEILKLDALVTRTGDAAVTGGIRDIGADLVGIGFFLAPVLLLLFVGFFVAAIAAGLLLAALASRQVRAAEQVITREPVQAFLVGLVATFVPIILIVALFVTIVGAPLAVGILFGLWPAVAFVGYLVAATWIGDWILARLTRPTTRERPYVAAVVGILVLQLLAIWPFLPMLASLFGYGAVLLLAWRTLRGSGGPRTVQRPTPAAMPT